MKKSMLIVLIFLGVIASGVYFLIIIFTREIVTSPMKAEVWVDGNYKGMTPYRLIIIDSKQHKLELIPIKRTVIIDGKTEPLDYLSLEYSFNRFTGPDKFRIRMIPDKVLDSLLENSDEITTDWDIWMIPTKNAHAIYSEKENKIIQVIKDASVIISPDGKQLFLSALKITSEKSYNVSWIAPLNDPEKRSPIFSEYDGMITHPIAGYGIGNGFSPDSKWIWFWLRPSLSVASTLNQETKIRIVSTGGEPVWSLDSTWIAEFTTDGQTQIFHLVDNEWQKLPYSYNGSPIGWSRNNQFLWIDENHTIKLIDMHKNQVGPEILSGGMLRGMVSSNTGDKVAFTYVPSDDNNNSHFLFVGKSDGTPILTLADKDYYQVIGWSNDDKQVFVMIDTDNGRKVEIIDSP